MMTMKIMDLAKLIYEMDTDGLIDFASGTEYDVERYGGWYGVKQCNPFDNDNLIYVVGHYGGEANTFLYTLSEYDSRIGDFCAPRLNFWKSPVTDSDYIECIARMLVDLFERNEGVVPSYVTVDNIASERSNNMTVDKKIDRYFNRPWTFADFFYAYCIEITHPSYF